MELQYTDITVSVKLDEKNFKRFARFDLLAVRKKWIFPALLSLFLIALAAAALLIPKEKPVTLAAILLVIGFALPLVWIGACLCRINRLTAKAGLDPDRLVYTVTLLDSGIQIRNGQEENTREVSWVSVWKAFRKKGCIYLYMTPSEAFLLPDRQADAPAHEVWDFLVRHLGADKCR